MHDKKFCSFYLFIKTFLFLLFQKCQAGLTFPVIIKRRPMIEGAFNFQSMDLYQILELSQSLDSDSRKNAEFFLQEIECHNIEGFYLNLSMIFCQKKINLEIRRLSGLILKNKIYSKEIFYQKETSKSWSIFPNILLKNKIKKNILEVLGDQEKLIRRVSSQILAKISQIELFEEEKTEIFTFFLLNLENFKFEKNLFIGTLETIQFVFQEIETKNLKIQIKQNLTEIISKLIFPLIIEKNDSADELKIASLTTLFYTLDLFDKIMEEEENTIYILNLVFTQIRIDNLFIQKIVFEILEKLIENYYEYFEKFIYFIFEHTLIILKNNYEVIGQSAIEFWISIADKEFGINTASFQALKEGRVPPIHSRFFINKTNHFLTEHLIDFTKKKKKNFEIEEWNCHNSAEICLNLMIQASPREILPVLTSYIKNNLIQKNSFLEVECALSVFIAIFDGIGPKMLYSNIDDFLEIFFQFIESQNFYISGLTIWAFGKICSVGSFFIREKLNQLIKLLFVALMNKEKVEKSPWSLNEISIGFGKEGVLSWSIEKILFSLFNPIFNKKNYKKRTNELFEVMGSFILNSSVREKAFILSCIPLIFKKFMKSFVDNGYYSVEEQEIQNCLLRAMNIIIQKRGKKFSFLLSKKILDFIQSLITLLNSCKTENTLDEEILIFFGITIQILPRNLPEYSGKIIPFILDRIMTQNNFQIMSLAIGIVGDICRCLSEEFKPYLEQTLQLLIKVLQDENLDKNLKPLILSCLGDVAFTTEDSSLKYFNFSIPFFKGASFFTQQLLLKDDPDRFEYKLSIKESILEGISSLIQNTNTKINIIETQKELEWILNFIPTLILEDRTLRITLLIIGLIGDLSLHFFNFKRIFFHEKWITQFLFEFEMSKDERVKNLGEWVKEILEL